MKSMICDDAVISLAHRQDELKIAVHIVRLTEHVEMEFMTATLLKLPCDDECVGVRHIQQSYVRVHHPMIRASGMRNKVRIQAKLV